MAWNVKTSLSKTLQLFHVVRDCNDCLTAPASHILTPLFRAVTRTTVVPLELSRQTGQASGGKGNSNVMLAESTGNNGGPPSIVVCNYPSGRRNTTSVPFSHSREGDTFGQHLGQLRLHTAALLVKVFRAVDCFCP